MSTPAGGQPGDLERAFGVYVHVPFCTRRCDYCAFATWTDRHHLIPSYVAGCRQELASAALPAATTVFFGGGTPSLLAPTDLEQLLAGVARRADAEVTLECNPETVTVERLAGYRAAGVTRLSFGVQSMVPRVLTALGRIHDPASVRAALGAAAESGFGGSYSVDLIYGAAGETLGEWEQTVRTVLAFDPPPSHVSAYALTPEPGTPLGAQPARHPDNDDQADKYLLADALLEDAGLAWYELSNWARPGAECRHNRLYWSQGPYRGIGCAAHSHELLPEGGARRWWNVRTPERYLRLVARRQSVVAAEDVLDEQGRQLEALQLSLRTRAGVPAAALGDDPRIDGLVERRSDGAGGGERAVLTPTGRLLANEVSLRLRVAPSV